MSPSSWKNWQLLPRLIEHLRLVARLLREPSVPFYLKAIVIAPLAYLVWPADLIPDFFPVVGQIDDLAIVLLAIDRVIALCPQALVDFHRAAIRRGAPYAPSDDAVTSPESRS